MGRVERAAQHLAVDGVTPGAGFAGACHEALKAGAELVGSSRRNIRSRCRGSGPVFSCRKFPRNSCSASAKRGDVDCGVAAGQHPTQRDHQNFPKIVTSSPARTGDLQSAKVAERLHALRSSRRTLTPGQRKGRAGPLPARSAAHLRQPQATLCGRKYWRGRDLPLPEGGIVYRPLRMPSREFRWKRRKVTGLSTTNCILRPMLRTGTRRCRILIGRVLVGGISSLTDFRRFAVFRANNCCDCSATVANRANLSSKMNSTQP